MHHVVSILSGAVFTIALCWAAGRILFRQLGIDLHRTEHDLLAAASGAAIVSFLVFLLCATHTATTAVFLFMGAAILGLYWRFGRGAAHSSLPPLPRNWKVLFWAIFALYALLYLSNSFAPELSPDGQAYHLGLVYRFFRDHGFRRLTTNMYANMPLGMEMLFLPAFALGRHSAAATVHCCYLLALPILMVSYARRIGHPRAGVCAALITGLSPVVGIDGISAYNDVALAVTAFAMFYLLEIWRDEQKDALLIPIGLLAGFCCAIKMTGFVAPLYAAAVILIRKRPRALVPVTAFAALMAAPWMLKDWIWLGNPMSPFLNRIFPNPWVHVLFEEDLRAFSRTYNLPGFGSWLRAVTTGAVLGGQTGVIFFLAPFALFALRSRVGRRFLLAALFFLIPYPGNIGARFLIPAMPFVAFGMALAFEFSQPLLATIAVAAAVLAWPGVLSQYASSGWRIRELPWRAALRIEPQDAFLIPRSLPWIEAKMLDYYVPPGKRVWGTGPIAESYAQTEYMVSYLSAEGDLLQDMITTAVLPDYPPTWNLRYTFRKHRAQHLRLEQTAAGANIWSIGEVRIYDGVNRVPRTPRWRLDADPYPWDIGLAFDDDPVTRWRSWEPIHPGMHVDVDFGEPTEFDRIELHSSHDQWGIQVQPEVCDGGCRQIRATLDKLEDPPYADLRRSATRQLKAHGIDYILVGDANWTAADMREDPSKWGMTFVAERGGNRLYKLQ